MYTEYVVIVQVFCPPLSSLADVLKLSDFGLSTVFRHQGRERLLNRRCGTPPYIAPEVPIGMRVFLESSDLHENVKW